MSNHITAVLIPKYLNLKHSPLDTDGVKDQSGIGIEGRLLTACQLTKNKDDEPHPDKVMSIVLLLENSGSGKALPQNSPSKVAEVSTPS